MTLLQVQHDDAFVDDVPPHPYHTRYFDVVTAIVPHQNRSTTEQEQARYFNEKPSVNYRNLDSNTSYEEAIIMAIIALREYQSGSTISSIRNYMKDNFIHDIYPYLIHHQLANERYPINNALFLVAMKSLLNKKIIEASFVKNGSCMSYFKLSQTFLHQRLEMIRKQHDIKRREEAQRVREIKFHQGQGKNAIVSAHGKVPFAKMKYFDTNAGVMMEQQKKEVNDDGGMDLDGITQTRKYSYLAKSCSSSNNSTRMMFITNRRRLGKSVKIPSNRIIVTQK